MRGLHSVEDLALRCTKTGKHWIWNGYTDSGRPSANLQGRASSGIRITALILGRDHERTPQTRWYAACGKSLCLSPDCLRLGPLAAAHKASAKTGRLKRTLATKILLSGLARRRHGNQQWKVEWARSSKQAAAEVGHALGVHRSTIYKWRREVKPVNPFAQLLGIVA